MRRLAVFTLLNLFFTAPSGVEGAFLKTPAMNKVTHVKVGEEKEVRGLKVQPLEVVEDSRCPDGAVCFVPGIIVVKVKLSAGGDAQEIYIGNSQGKTVLLDAHFRDQKVYKYRPAFFNGYSISFSGAKARRTETDKLAQDEYSLDFVISRSK